MSVPSPRVGHVPEDPYGGMSHHYGPNFHISSSPVVATRLARLRSGATFQPDINRLIREMYRHMTEWVVSRTFPQITKPVETRMIQSTRRGIWTGSVLDPATPVVVASMMRAGNLPGQVCFDLLCELLDGNVVRHDFFGVARQVGNDQRVTGSQVSYEKVGGPFKDAVLLIPDPMGATGSSIVETMNAYDTATSDRPTLAIAIHLIITPEYVQRVKEELPHLVVFAAAIDRGMSDPEILGTVPGALPGREYGLNGEDYIVPGAGGLGEIMTNAFV